MSNQVNYEPGELTSDAMKAVKALSLEDALKPFNDGFPIRTIDEVICEAVGYSLRKEWCKVTPTEAEAVLQEKMGDDFLNYWITPNNTRRLNRKSAMRIALALEINVPVAEFFLKRCWLDGFYMRDVSDVIYVYALKNGWSYQEAERWILEYTCLDTANDIPDVDDYEIQGEVLTVWLDNQLNEVHSEPEALKVFIQKNRSLFGTFRRRLYNRFKGYYNEIKGVTEDVYNNDFEKKYVFTPDEYGIDIDYDPDYDEEGNQITDDRSFATMKDVMDVIGAGIYELKESDFASVVLGRMTEKFPLQKEMYAIINKQQRDAIRATKDKETKDGNIKPGRKPDGRKIIRQASKDLFILAWLASEDGKDINRYAKDTEEVGVAYENHILALNGVLEDLGMPRLDHRHPLDWVVLNALFCAHCEYKGVGDAFDDAASRLQDFFEALQQREGASE